MGDKPTETQLRNTRERVVKELKNSESNSYKWHKLEAVETALDYALGENEILLNMLESYENDGWSFEEIELEGNQ